VSAAKDQFAVEATLDTPDDVALQALAVAGGAVAGLHRVLDQQRICASSPRRVAAGTVSSARVAISVRPPSEDAERPRGGAKAAAQVRLRDLDAEQAAPWRA
jgi:hypothetical protein